MDNILQGTLQPSNIKNKDKIRQAALDLLSRGEDPSYVRYHLYRTTGANINEIDNEINTFQQLKGGTQPSPNSVTVGGRTHQINTLSDEKAYQEMTAKTNEEETLKQSAMEDFSLKLERINEAVGDKDGLKAAV